MKKWMKITGLLMLMFPVVANAEDYVYTESAHKIEIDDYIGPGGDVTIPDTIIGYPVTSIHANAFGYNTNLTSVTIGSNVTSIGWVAFRGCSVLTNVTISRGVTSIEPEAFNSCPSLRAISVDNSNSYYSSTNGALLNKNKTILIQCPGGKVGSFMIPDSVTNIEFRAIAECCITNVIIGSGVTSIGDEAFESSTNLTSITIGNSVTSIGMSAFRYCYSLTNAVIGNGVTNLGSGGTFYQCSNLTSVTIGANVAGIGGSTFDHCSSLKNVTIPNSATFIGAGAFWDCSSLTNVTIGNSITNIGSSAFFFCTSLASIAIPDSVTFMGNDAFCYCTSAVSVVIGNGVTSIGNDAFSSCESLTNVVIGSSVASIGEYAFDSCGMPSITIPNSVASIGYSAFGGCTSLNGVTIGTGVTSIGEGAFWECTKLTSVTIPDNVRSIGSSAFWFCTNLTSAMIGNGVTNIGLSAFGYCTNLTGVYFQGNAPAVSTNLFGAASSLPVVYRRSGASGWPTVPAPWSGRPTALWVPGSSYLLTVSGGTGGGSYTNMQRVTITANDPASGKVFDRWTGAVQYVASVTSSPTTVMMPAQDITLVATYKDTYRKFDLTVTGGTGGGSYTPGQKVTIAATVPVGWKFDHWGDATQCLASATSSPTVVTMPPNAASVTAVLKDIQIPALTLSSPLTGARLTNAAAIVTGKATDNSGATDVLIQLNGGSWTTNNALLRTTNWTANLTLQPGSNSVKVCARDATGNSSATNTLTLTYVLYGNLTIQTNGLGTVARAPATAPEVGATYTLTATPGTGFGFANWTGDVTTSTNKVLTFTMTTNKPVTANFVDIAKPSVAITLPTAALRVSNSTYTVKGTATDNGVMTGVFCRVNSGEWTRASTTNLTTNVWKSWSIPVTLTAGSNLVQVYSMDKAGNISATSSVSCAYVVLGTLAVTTNGVGTVTRAPATPPEVNQKYTLTAAAGTGSVFSNWTGDVTSTNKVITFTMTTNLAIRANFTDIAKPTIAITAPTALQRILGTNGEFTVKGTATDNSTLSNVMVKVNTDAPVPASTTTNGWKNWSLPVMLTPGTNIITAYSVDTTGNCSLTVTTKCVYVETGTLIINTNGPGTVAIAPAGALELGKSYTLTATAGTGGVFSNWTGDVTGTGKVVTISLTVSNRTKTVSANFTDTAKPTVTITSPTAAQRVMTNGTVILRGTAADNGVLGSVRYQLGTGEWTNAVSTNIWKNWTAACIPVVGTNIAKVCSVDAQGNTSAASTVVFTYVPGAVMQVQTNGNGTITPSYNGQVLEIGKSYTMTATAKTGNVFTNWTDGIGVVTNKAAVTFKMTSNLVLTANFRSLTPMPAPMDAVVAQAEITVDGATADWAYVPRTSFSYASVTQEVAAALSGNNIALLLNGCPFNTSDTVLVYFKLRLSYSSGDARHSVDLWTSGKVLYGMVDGQVITGFEAVLVNGVLEVKFPFEQAPSQITIEEAGCGIDTGSGALTELFRLTPPVVSAR